MVLREFFVAACGERWVIHCAHLYYRGKENHHVAGIVK